ncbi:MAG: hypothetical protein P0107_08970 [Nitrosomonas sp.]|nr:hypothetical protein [Nitrosomonas sp.]
MPPLKAQSTSNQQELNDAASGLFSGRKWLKIFHTKPIIIKRIKKIAGQRMAPGGNYAGFAAPPDLMMGLLLSEDGRAASWRRLEGVPARLRNDDDDFLSH